MMLRVTNHPGLPGTGPVSALKVLGHPDIKSDFAFVIGCLSQE